MCRQTVNLPELSEFPLGETVKLHLLGLVELDAEELGRVLHDPGHDLVLALRGEELEAAIVKALDNEAPGIIGDLVDSVDVLEVVSAHDLLRGRISLDEGVGAELEEAGDPLLRPVVLVAEP